MADILKEVTVDKVEKKISKALSTLKKNVTCHCKVNVLDFTGKAARMEVEVTSEELVQLSVVSPETDEKLQEIISDEDIGERLSKK